MSDDGWGAYAQPAASKAPSAGGFGTPDPVATSEKKATGFSFEASSGFGSGVAVAPKQSAFGGAQPENKPASGFGGFTGGSSRIGGGGNGFEISTEGSKPASTFVPVDEDTEVLYHADVEKGSMFKRFYDATVTSVLGGQGEGQNAQTRIIQRFDELGLGDKAHQNIIRSGYTKPTPVQQHVMPVIKEEHHLKACAQTGSGKTAAFLLPVMNKLIDDRNLGNSGEISCYPRCVIVAPTRELAVQIYNECRKFDHGTILSAAVVYGGTHVGH